MGSSKAALSAYLMLLGVASAAVAEPPSGNYVIEVGGEDLRLTLAHGDAEVCEVEPEGEICVTTTAGTAAWGAVGGTGALTLTGDLEGVISFAFSAFMHGTPSKPKLKKPKIYGNGVLSDSSSSFDVEIEGRMKCKLDPALPDRFECNAKTRLCAVVAGRKIDCTSISFPVPIAAEEAPPFQVNLALETDAAGAITGTAEVIVEVGDDVPFYNPESFDFAVRKGKYVSSNDTSKIDFRVTAGDLSNKLALKNVVFESGIATRGNMKFNVTGQKGLVQITPPP